MERAVRISSIPQASVNDGRSPSSIDAAMVPITGVASVPMLAAPAGSSFRMKNQSSSARA